MFAFRLVLAGLAASTVIGVTFALASPAEFRAIFPGAARPAAYGALIATGVVGLVALGGLWHWRPWGIVLYGVVVMASIGLDVVAGAPALHQLAVVVGAVAVLGLAYANRARFRTEPAGGVT